jgi:hypothetical protein
MKSFAAKAGLTLLMVACPVAFASPSQSVANDMKQAGHDVKNATVHTGKTVEHAVTRKSKKPKNEANRAAHKGSKNSEKSASRVKPKTKK